MMMIADDDADLFRKIYSVYVCIFIYIPILFLRQPFLHLYVPLKKGCECFCDYTLSCRQYCVMTTLSDLIV